MKDFRKLRTLAAGAAALALISISNVAQAQTMEQGTAIARKVIGQVQYSTGGGVWIPVKQGDKLSTGATVQVGAEAQVDFYLGVNGPTLRVTHDTTVALDNLTFQGSGEDVMVETKLNLSDGRILGSVRKLAKSSKYEVKTPTGIAAIRGTDYDISTHKNAGGKFDTQYLCINGEITGTDGTTPFDIADGKGFNGGTGLVFPISPVDLQILIKLIADLDTILKDLGLPLIPIPNPVLHISPTNPHH